MSRPVESTRIVFRKEYMAANNFEVFIHYLKTASLESTKWKKAYANNLVVVKGALSWAEHARVCLFSRSRKILAAIMDSRVTYIRS